MRFVICFLALAAAAQERPSIGWTLGRDGVLRRLDGIAGAFRTGPAARDGIKQFFHDGGAGWQVRGRVLERFGAAQSWDLDEGPVVLFAAGAYQPRTGALYSDTAVERHAHLVTDDRVLAAGWEAGVLTRIVQRGADLRLERLAVAGGALLEARALADAADPLVVVNGEILTAPAELDAAELFAIGEGWYQARGAVRDYVLRRREGRWEVFEIPAAAETEDQP